MTANNSKGLIAWGHMNAATEMMDSAYGMVWVALWESDNINDPIGVSDRLRKLLSEVKELTNDMQHGTSQLFHDSLDDEKPTTAE